MSSNRAMRVESIPPENRTAILAPSCLLWGL